MNLHTLFPFFSFPQGQFSPFIFQVNYSANLALTLKQQFALCHNLQSWLGEGLETEV